MANLFIQSAYRNLDAKGRLLLPPEYRDALLAAGDGNFGVDLSQGMNAMWGEYNVFGKVNHKKSEFGVSYYMGPRDFYGMYRDNEEEFHLADGTTLHRIEEGEPGHGSVFMNNLSTNYNLQQTENSLFSATFRLRSNSPVSYTHLALSSGCDGCTGNGKTVTRLYRAGRGWSSRTITFTTSRCTGCRTSSQCTSSPVGSF